jgi:RNA polymerase sigma factor for flagellar operon FliA
VGVNAAPAAQLIDAATREQLIMEHLPQVRLIARKIYDRLPEHVSMEDLVSTGVVGLIAAIDRYEPAQGVKLKTYAEYKIRGAILDSLRGMDWAPRKQRQRAKQIQRAVAAAQQRRQETATEADVAAEIGITVEEYRHWASDARAVRVSSLAEVQRDEPGTELIHFIKSGSADLPSEMLETSQLRELLACALERMPRTERTVLTLYYHEELTLREIARVLDVHESRVSQVKSQALGRLRAFLDLRWPAKGAKPVRNQAQ